MEVIVLGPGNSVCISPGRQAHWIAVTELVPLENLEWVVNGTFTKLVDGRTSVIAEPVWQKQIINYQLGFLKGEVFDASQHSKEAGPHCPSGSCYTIQAYCWIGSAQLGVGQQCSKENKVMMQYTLNKACCLSGYRCGPNPKVFWPEYDLCCWQQQGVYMYIIS